MKILLSIITMASLVLSSQAAQAADAEEEVNLMLDFFAEEWNAGDLESIRSRFHRDFVLVTESGTRNRAQRLEDMSIIFAPGKDHGELTFSDVEVQAIGKEHALAYGRSRLKFGDGTELGSMFSSVYVNTPFGWKLLLTHE